MCLKDYNLEEKEQITKNLKSPITWKHIYRSLTIEAHSSLE